LTTAAATTIAVSATVAVPEVADRVHGGNSVALGGAKTFDLSAGEIGTLRFDARAGERVFVEMTDSTTGMTTLTLESFHVRGGAEHLAEVVQSRCVERPDGARAVPRDDRLHLPTSFRIDDVSLK
jgi:hypothetical protein